MGIIDRIAGTLEELAGEGEEAAAREEIALAMAQADRGDLEDAEKRFAEVAARFPTLSPAFVRLGQIRARRGALEEAVTALGKAVDLDGDSAEAWWSLGDALARLRRTEPARDALRRAVALAAEPGSSTLRGHAHATLGQVYADAGQLGKAVRELGKALELLGDDPEVSLTYGRTLARAGERQGAEWLTRAARRSGAPPRLFVEAAAATADAGLAEKLLREGLSRAPEEGALKAALARHLAWTGRAAEALVLALDGVAASPASTDALAALREAYAGAGRWADALAVTRREAELGVSSPAATRLALALAAQDRGTLAALAEAPDVGGIPVSALRTFLAGNATDEDLVALAGLAPDEPARRFVVAAQAPPPPPATNLAGLLTWTHDLAARAPALMGLAVGAGRAVEAFDRPLLVAVMGEFNAGKSSFVNALVGDEVAPTGVTPTTATVNVLRHGAATAARVVYHDGTARELGPASVGPFLRELSDAQAASVRLVEIFHPLETLRRVEIVDTPGLNSIRPEHEKVARDFLVEADALVWVFAIGQAAKASEKQALALAHGEGKHVLGVLNKIDGASEDDIRAVVRHVQGGLGELVDEVVPFSATRALAARRAGATDSALAALESALERHFFGRARALKRATAVAALQRFASAARTAVGEPAAAEFPARRAALVAVDQRVRGALASERVALRARLDEATRTAAFEVRDFVRPRAWLFGEHRADAADERFLIELLEDAVERATDVTRDVLKAAITPPDGAGSDPDPLAPATRAAVERAVDAAIERFAAYAHGVIEGGSVAEFFRYDLPRIRLDLTAIRAALTRRSPDPEQVLFGALAHDLAAAYRLAQGELDSQEADAAIRRMLREEHLERPLNALARAVEELAAEGPR
jgi:tetratricopeptide (TPR) repeat protein/GTP-binding protein EngB required for normal cell division